MDDFLSTPEAQKMAIFHLPDFSELPLIELYLDQVLTLLHGVLRPLLGAEEEAFATPSMISNYIKQGVIARPQKKRYTREHVAYLVFVFLSKQVLQLSDVQRLIDIQKKTYPIDVAYNYFCTEFENMLHAVFTASALPKDTVSRETNESKAVRFAVSAIVNKIYLSKYLENMIVVP